MKRAATGILLLACIGCDRVAKTVAREHLAGRPTLSYAHDVLRLTYAENAGAILSTGARLPSGARFAVFTVLVGVGLAAGLVWLMSRRQMPMRTAVPAALIVAGGFGNWIDRVMHGGLVVDFLNMGIGSVRTGIFNVADMAITCGAVVLLVMSFLPQRRKEEEA